MIASASSRLSSTVSGLGFITTVQPAASSGPSLNIASDCGKFHGTIAPTTPTGLLTMWIVPPSSPGRSSSKRGLADHAGVVAREHRREDGLGLHRDRDRHAVLQRHPLGGLLAAAFQRDGQPLQRLRAILRRPGRPTAGVIERGARGGNGGVDVRVRALRHRSHRFLGARGGHEYVLRAPRLGSTRRR